ncbi:MAG: PQQ-binding-like beta-propeller repeat protein [Planctomycetota bacterium]|nr:PQQ-binding-like beta-propeller repeat protein [Planctomycetota bacterium]
MHAPQPAEPESPELVSESGTVPQSQSLNAPSLRPALWIIGLGAGEIVGTWWLIPDSTFQLASLFLGPATIGLALLGWLLFGLHIRWKLRLSLLLWFTAHAATTGLLVDRSVLVSFAFLGLPLAAIATSLSAWLLQLLRWPAPRRLVVLSIPLTLFPWLLLGSDGTTGESLPIFRWRWQLTTEQRWLRRTKPPTQTSESKAERTLLGTDGDWTGFRGPRRDGKVSGIHLQPDWKQHPPQQLWRREIGPGWSSFCVVENRVFTQEQRGDSECVVCYHASTGDLLWVHEDRTRFWDAAGGAGPRATPSFLAGRLYTLGATGILNCLAADSGKLEWSVNIAQSNQAPIPIWGFTGSPLVWKDLVVVCAGGAQQQSVIAYDRINGRRRWASGSIGAGYGSPHFATLHGVEQVIIIDDEGVSGYELLTGRGLWQFDLGGIPGDKTLQPCLLDQQSFLVGMGNGIGTRFLHCTRSGDDWRIEQRWLSKGLKPKFSDLLYHQGYIYGLDGKALVCLAGDSGKRLWKGGRYGAGQLILLGDNLLVTAENGELALVAAQPDRYRERGRIKGLEGKTWNHPAYARGQLFVRNGREAACYTLPQSP